MRLNIPGSVWSKLQYLCHAGPTEVGGYMDSDGLDVESLHLIPQTAGPAHVDFTDAGIAAHFAAGHGMRVWVHTHPGDSAQPSGTDEETWARVHGRQPWSVMLILARGGATYCRVRVGAEIGALQTEVPIRIDWSDPTPTDPAAWAAEYNANVKQEQIKWTDDVRTDKSPRRPSQEPASLWSESDLWDGLSPADLAQWGFQD